MSDDYESRLAEWKAKHGVPEDRVGDEIPPSELRMIAEDAKAQGNDYCWICGDEFPIREMLIETSPYNQMDEGAIAEDGYIKAEDRVRKCKACAKREDDEEAGIEDGAEPTA